MWSNNEDAIIVYITNNYKLGERLVLVCAHAFLNQQGVFSLCVIWSIHNSNACLLYQSLIINQLKGNRPLIFLQSSTLRKWGWDQSLSSLNWVKFLDSLHESADAYCVRAGRCRVSTAWIAHKLFCTVVHGIKLSNLVAKSNALEQSLDFVSLAWQLEVILTDSHLSESGREQKVDSLWLISIILYLIAE